MTRLFELRKERGLSQRDMAVEFSVSQSTYNNWENARTQPSIEQLIAMARFFEVSVDYLVGNSDDAGTINYITTLSPDEKRVWDALGADECSLDQLAQRTGLPLPALTATVIALQMQRRIRPLPGGLLRRA